VHLNPNVQQPVKAILSDHPRIALLPLIHYSALLWLMERAHLILSDSCCIQEEAPSFGKPLLVMRHTTEPPEVLDAGCTKLVGTDTTNIVNEARVLMSDVAAYAKMSTKPNPFW
jgi:UDP-N-acetylglucosamine 2-epimerase